MIKLKKIISLVLVIVLCLSFAACGISGGSTTYYKLGDTVSTDIFEFTLNAAEFTVALNNINDDNRYTPKEYDPEEDDDNPYVAPVGHTYAAFSYTVTNLNRASSEFHTGSFASVEYENKKYSAMDEGAYFQYEQEQYMDVNGSLKTKKAGEWYSDPGNNLLLLTGEKETRRARIDIEAEIKDLTADVKITFKIPNSEGKTEDFTYLVTSADRETYTKPEIEMSLDLAMVSFEKDEGQAYFKAHKDDYSVVNGDNITKVLTKKWDVVIRGNVGFWKGSFWFEDDGRIRDTYGYVNNRTWKLNGDTLTIDNESDCEMRKVADNIYVLYCGDNPYMLMY